MSTYSNIMVEFFLALLSAFHTLRNKNGIDEFNYKTIFIASNNLILINGEHMEWLSTATHTNHYIKSITYKVNTPSCLYLRIFRAVFQLTASFFSLCQRVYLGVRSRDPVSLAMPNNAYFYDKSLQRKRVCRKGWKICQNKLELHTTKSEWQFKLIYLYTIYWLHMQTFLERDAVL